MLGYHDDLPVEVRVVQARAREQPNKPTTEERNPSACVETSRHSSATQGGSSEREAQCRAVMALYHPPVRLKKNHKDLLKTAWSIKQGYDGSKLECLVCGVLRSLAEITVHHKDNAEEHNDPDNLEPACWECNRTEGVLVRRRLKAQVATRERELNAQAPVLAYPGESESLQRHKQQRLAFNIWLYHPKTGIPQGGLLSKRGTAMQAVDVVSMGSWKTYWSYVEEDIAGGYWERKDTPEGEMIERTAKPFPLARMGMEASE